jgi:hypothetical protein
MVRSHPGARLLPSLAAVTSPKPLGEPKPTSRPTRPRSAAHLAPCRFREHSTPGGARAHVRMGTALPFAPAPCLRHTCGLFLSRVEGEVSLALSIPSLYSETSRAGREARSLGDRRPSPTTRTSGKAETRAF